MAVWFEQMPPMKNSIQSRMPTQYPVDAFAFRNSSPNSNFLFGFSWGILPRVSSMALRPMQTPEYRMERCLPPLRPLSLDPSALSTTSPALPPHYRLFGSSAHPRRTVPPESTSASTHMA